MKQNGWSHLNCLQLGKYAEYFTKMEFSAYGFDIYTPEIDNKGTDFIIKSNNIYYDIQVKSCMSTTTVIQLNKKTFTPKENYFITVVYFKDNELPELFLVPSNVWSQKTTASNLFTEHKDEWAININSKNIEELKQYSFEEKIKKLSQNTNNTVMAQV